MVQLAVALSKLSLEIGQFTLEMWWTADLGNTVCNIILPIFVGNVQSPLPAQTCANAFFNQHKVSVGDGNCKTETYLHQSWSLLNFQLPLPAVNVGNGNCGEYISNIKLPMGQYLPPSWSPASCVITCLPPSWSPTIFVMFSRRYQHRPVLIYIFNQLEVNVGNGNCGEYITNIKLPMGQCRPPSCSPTICVMSSHRYQHRPVLMYFLTNTRSVSETVTVKTESHFDLSTTT